jgi:hypothetical protein
VLNWYSSHGLELPWQALVERYRAALENCLCPRWRFVLAYLSVGAEDHEIADKRPWHVSNVKKIGKQLRDAFSPILGRPVENRMHLSCIAHHLGLSPAPD